MVTFYRGKPIDPRHLSGYIVSGLCFVFSFLFYLFTINRFFLWLIVLFAEACFFVIVFMKSSYKTNIKYFILMGYLYLYHQ